MKIATFSMVISMSFLIGCSLSPQEWAHQRTIDLGSTTPIGLTVVDQHFWVADGDNNQLVHLDKEGKILFKEEGFERPMHITTDGKSIFIPEYGKDQVTIFQGKDKVKMLLTDSLDAPAGIHYNDGFFAIADFYNHRILYGKEDQWIRFGQEGKENGEFYYPTDVHIFDNQIYVADAYNNRIQMFDVEGNFLLTFGAEEKIKAATGIFVSNTQVFITDFENNRVLIYSHEGLLEQIIDRDLNSPTDVFLHEEILIVANYKGKNLMFYEQE